MIGLRLVRIGLPLIFAVAGVWISEIVLDRSVELNELDVKASNFFLSKVAPIPVDDRIILVKVDADSVLELGGAQPESLLSRTLYREYFQRLAKTKVLVSLSDIGFASDSKEDAGFGDGIDDRFCFVKVEVPLETEGEISDDGFAYDFKICSALSSKPATFGHALSFAPDGVVQSVLAQAYDNSSGNWLFHTALLAAWKAEGLDVDGAKITGTQLVCGDWKRELGGNNDFFNQYPGSLSEFNSIPFSKALGKLRQGTQEFDGKIMVLVDSRPGKDEHTTSQFGRTAGYNITASVLNSALSPASKSIRWASAAQEYAYSLALGLLGVVVFGLMPRRSVGLALGLIVPLILSWVIPLTAASSTRVILPMVQPVLTVGAVVFGCLLTLALRSKPIDTRVPGMNIPATVLFSDIEDSTGLVQQIGAQRYQEIYGAWVRQCGAIIAKRGGELERTTGDGFVATFAGSANLTVERAILAVEEMTLELQSVSKRYEIPLNSSFGMSAGEISGGYVFEAGIETWSSSGATVNRAKRIQTLAGQLGVNLLADASVIPVVPKSFGATAQGSHDLKGFEEPVELYSISARS